MLLDTHVLLWVLEDNPRLGPLSRDRVTAGAVVHFSAASLWELAIKARLGKITLPEDFGSRPPESGLVELAVTAAHTCSVRSLPAGVPRDPFDQLLLAQADCEDLELLTADARLLALGLTFVRDARE